LRLAGGAWDAALRPALTSIAGAVPVLLALVLPLLVVAPSLYPWLRGDVAPTQRWWLNPWTVGIGLALCGAFWLWLERRLRRAPPLSRATAGVAALLHLLATTVVAVDLLMSLQPAYRSTSLGVQTAVAQALAALALALLVTPPLPRRDAALASGLLLMLALLWSYLCFMSYLTAWTADLPDEIVWELPRTRTSWAAFTVSGALLQGPLVIVALAVPALRRGRGLRALGAGVLSGSALYAQAQVGGATHPHGAMFGVEHAAALIGIAAWFWLCFARRFAPPRFDAQADQAEDERARATNANPPPRRARRETPPRGDWRAESQWDVPGRAASRLAFGFAVALCAIVAVLYVYYGTLFADRQQAGRRIGAPPPEPRLQLDAQRGRETYAAAERARLDRYRWVDRAHGIAQIPIERAMQIEAEQERGS
jgi:hypothetical protein